MHIVEFNSDSVGHTQIDAPKPDSKKLRQELKELQPIMAKAAQNIYNEWDSTSGICYEIADEITFVIRKHLKNAVARVVTHPSNKWSQLHFWVRVSRGAEHYDIDIPFGKYEQYDFEASKERHWPIFKKIPDVTFTANDILIYRSGPLFKQGPWEKYKKYVPAANDKYYESVGSPIKFHSELNPKLWEHNKLIPIVRDHLLVIAKFFVDDLNIDTDMIQDITLNGSNAAYTYTEYSDIDLHIIMTVPSDKEKLYREYFDAKKTIFNSQHDVLIHDMPVEVYVQFDVDPFVSNGIYSVYKDKWLEKPKKIKVGFDDLAVRTKIKHFARAIQSAVTNNNYELAEKLREQIRNYRKSGLISQGEFGSGNMVFKVLRTSGLIKKLVDFCNQYVDKEMSLEGTL
jgi:hypothetical protein